MRLSLLFTLAFSIVFGMTFSSCTKKEGGGGNVSIVIWTNKLPQERETLQILLDRYQKENPTVKVTQQFFETEECRDRYINSVLGQKGPDLMFGPSDPIGPLVVMKTLKPFDGLISPKLKNALVADAFVGFEGKTYQVASTIGNHLMLIYNKKLVPKPPKTFDELIEMGKKFAKDTNGDGKLDQFGLVWNYIEPYFMIPFLTGYGGWVMDDNSNPTLDTPAMVSALKLILQLRGKDKIIPLECDYDTAEALFKENKALFIVNGTWSLPSYFQAKMDIGVTRIPMLPGQKTWPAPMKSPMGYSLNVYLNEVKLPHVMKLLEFLVSDEAQAFSFDRDKTLPTSKAVAASPKLKADSLVTAVLDQREVARNMPVHPNLRVIWDQMRPPYQKTMLGKITPEEAAAEMQKNTVEAIKRMKRE